MMAGGYRAGMLMPGQADAPIRPEPVWDEVVPPTTPMVQPSDPALLVVGALVTLTYNLFARYCLRGVNGPQARVIATCGCGGEMTVNAADLLVIDDPDGERICGPLA